MIRVKRCTKTYAGKSVIRDIELQVARGQFVGIIGPNGSGKTTLLRLMSGEERPDQGSVELNGRKVEQWRTRELAKCLTVVPQEGLQPVPFTVYDVVMMGRHVYQGRFHRASAADHAVVRRTLRVTGLQEISQNLVTHISGGERQRVAIARAMAQEPTVLLLDEPTTYLDIGYQLAVLRYVQDWQQQTGATVVAVLHDLNLAAQFCERIILLHGGRFFADGPPAAVIQPDILQKVYQTRPHVVSHPSSGVPQVLLGTAQKSPQWVEQSSS